MAQSTILSAGVLCGTEVKTSQGEHIGMVREVMIDVERGRVAYAALSFHGFAELSDRLFAVPWEALQLDEEDETFILDVTASELNAASGVVRTYLGDSH